MSTTFDNQGAAPVNLDKAWAKGAPPTSEYTDEEISKAERTAWETTDYAGLLWFRAFLAALPARPDSADIARLKAEVEQTHREFDEMKRLRDVAVTQLEQTQAALAVRARLIQAAKGQGEVTPQTDTKEASATFEAHGKTWTRHTPGDPMPCNGEALVEVLLREEEDQVHPVVQKASLWYWESLADIGSVGNEVIGWRYAEQQPEPAQPQAVVVKEPAQDEKQPDLSGESEKQVEADPYARLKDYAKAGARIRAVGREWTDDVDWAWCFPADSYEVHPDDLHLCPEYAPKTTVRIEAVPQPDPRLLPTGVLAYGQTPVADTAVAADGTTYHNPAEHYRAAEEAECVGKWLDQIGAPTHDKGGNKYSLVGRIRAFYDEAPAAQPEPAAQPWTPAVGDTVRLKSGGPVMTVRCFTPENAVVCDWFNPEEERNSSAFPSACLTPAQP